MNKRNDRIAGITEAQLARAELYKTLAALQERLNYAKRFDLAAAKLGRKLSNLQRTKPLLFGAAVAASALATGAAAWAIASKINKKFF